jgi:hypothetical protein
MTGIRFKVIAAMVLIAFAAGDWFFLKNHLAKMLPSKTARFLRASMPDVAALKAEEIEFSPAILQGKIQVNFVGNGRERMRMTASNQGERTMILKVNEGQILANSNSRVVVVRPGSVLINPGETVMLDLRTAALSSGNKVMPAVYTPSPATEPKLAALLAHVKSHPEMSAGTIQTAVLALTENLPVSAFAKFARPDGDMPSRFDTTPFKVEVSDLICALTALRNIGVPDSQLALTIDPQLKSEAMIDPLAHAYAMQYYHIPFQNEWSYWKQELLQGDPALRHYALYGIARFYPDVALQMLPNWARARSLSPVFRLSAVRAIVETQRTEALSVLHQFEHEFGSKTELGKSAREAAGYLDARLNQPPPQITVAYRTTRTVGLRQPTVTIAVVAAAN